jgi:hypothetical protein
LTSGGGGEGGWDFLQVARECWRTEHFIESGPAPISHIDYYLKPVIAEELDRLGKAPHGYMVIRSEGEPEGYVAVGIHHGEMVWPVSKPDLMVLGMRVALGKDLPYIKHKPPEL